MKLYPVLIFCYNRFDCLEKTVESLAKNVLASQTDIIIFSDGPKGPEDRTKVRKVRDYLNSINQSQFKSLTIFKAIENKGLAKSIIDGVSEVLKCNEAVIVLEDDLLTSNNFLNFINQGLHEFKNNSKVISISGYTTPVKAPEGYQYDNYFTRRASSWGWATWKNRWDLVDWKVSDYKKIRFDILNRKKFNEMGSDMSQMLDKQMKGKISSWAIVWCYHQFKFDLISVYPLISKISNIGFGNEATHTKGDDNRFATILDNSANQYFSFNPNVVLKNSFTKQFTKKFSLKSRIYYKLKRLI